MAVDRKNVPTLAWGMYRHKYSQYAAEAVIGKHVFVFECVFVPNILLSTWGSTGGYDKPCPHLYRTLVQKTQYAKTHF